MKVGLVLTRHEGERLCVLLPDGREIWICLVRVNPLAMAARIGINAPEDVQVHREEFYEEIKTARAGNAN